jgi:hypothetical protein
MWRGLDGRALIVTERRDLVAGWRGRISGIGYGVGMAYGFCPNCGCSVRYRVSAGQRVAWLNRLAAEIGRGEPAAVLCYGCWKPPEIGDAVEVLDPPPAGNVIRRRAKGIVTAIDHSEGVRFYRVEGASENPWRCRFERRQIRVLTEGAEGTLGLHLRSDTT